MTEFTIPVSAWGEFSQKIAKLNKRAVKLGCDPIKIEKLGESIVKREHTFKRDGEEVTRKFSEKAVTILLTGEAPKLEGFLFVARIEYLSDSKSKLFHTVPGADVKIDDRFRDLPASVCEHCNKSRMRRDTFVVLKLDTGVQTQVGRQCLADFTGINNPALIAAKASWLSTFEGFASDAERMWGMALAEKLDRQDVLSLTSAYIARLGWVPKSACDTGKSPTAHDVGDHFWGAPTNEEARKFLREMSALANEPEHQERAARVIAWVRDELADKARSDYEMNLVTLVAGELIERKHLGIVCSAVSAYQRAHNQKIEYANRREAQKDSVHVGKVGERMRKLVVKIDFLRAMEGGMWGPRTLVKFADENGNVLTWFASGDHDYRVGQSVVIDGTVKKHDEFQGIKQTVLSRVAVHETANKANAPVAA